MLVLPAKSASVCTFVRVGHSGCRGWNGIGAHWLSSHCLDTWCSRSLAFVHCAATHTLVQVSDHRCILTADLFGKLLQARWNSANFWNRFIIALACALAQPFVLLFFFSSDFSRSSIIHPWLLLFLLLLGHLFSYFNFSGKWLDGFSFEVASYGNQFCG